MECFTEWTGRSVDLRLLDSQVGWLIAHLELAIEHADAWDIDSYDGVSVDAVDELRFSLMQQLVAAFRPVRS